MRVFSGTSQGGSVAGFLVVGIVLVVLSVGGVYFVQQREGSEPAETGPTASNNTEENSDKKEDRTPTNSPAIPQSNTQDDDQGNQKALPETGPADSFLIIFAVAILSGFIVAYIQSSMRYRFATVQRLD